MDYKTVSLSDQVFEQLESDILSGKYQRGDIITEMQLCSELGVSRTPIREALRRLFQEHLIEDTPRGTMVLSITPKDFRDMSEIRLRIEELAVRGFMHNRTEERMKELNKKIQQYRRNSIQTPERAAKSVQEHRDILAAIAAGDEELAVQRMNQHIEHAIHRALDE